VQAEKSIHSPHEICTAAKEKGSGNGDQTGGNVSKVISRTSESHSFRCCSVLVTITPNIRRRNVLLGADDPPDLTDVAPAEPLQLALGHLLGIADDAALAAA